MNFGIKYIVLGLLLGSCLPFSLAAAVAPGLDVAVADSLSRQRKGDGGVNAGLEEQVKNYTRKKEEEKLVPLSPGERFSLKTNTIDWALMVANVGVEYDLSASPYGRFTLGANVRYAGGASASFVPKFDLGLVDVRCELRRYWRQRMTMREGQKRPPKLWRAYYWGAYVGYTDYKVYFSTGYKGSAVQVGGSFGYEMPLLQFKHGFLDLDLGLSAGFSYQKYDKSKLIEGVVEPEGEGLVDQRVIVESEDGKFIPYPMLTEIRVGLVYRFKSVRDKYTKKRHN